MERKRPCDCNSLLLSAAEIAGVIVALFVKSDLFEQHFRLFVNKLICLLDVCNAHILSTLVDLLLCLKLGCEG